MKQKSNYFIERQKVMLKFIKDYFAKHGYAPSVREIMDGTSYKSPSSVQYYMEWAFDNGYLATEAGIQSPRAFRITKKGEEFCE